VKPITILDAMEEAVSQMESFLCARPEKHIGILVREDYEAVHYQRLNRQYKKFCKRLERILATLQSRQEILEEAAQVADSWECSSRSRSDLRSEIADAIRELA